MVFLTFMIGIMNLCLGYAVAVHLGYGPLNPWDVWHPLPAAPPEGNGPAHGAPSGHSALGAWKVALATEASGLAALGNRLRECEERSNEETIRECAAALKELCETTLREQGEAAKRFQGRFGQSHELATTGKELEEAIFEQLAQLETTIGNLKRVDLEFDLLGTGRRLMVEVDRMLVASRKLWNDLGVAFSLPPAVNVDQMPVEKVA